MNLKFYYYLFNDELFPTVEIDDFDILAMYLLDHGGCFTSHMDFFEECIYNAKNNIEFDMSSNSYGVIKNNNNLVIYFIHDEDKSVPITLNNFIAILQLWVDFLRKNPSLNYKECHTIKG